jgi:hypothetical protein
MDQREKNPGQTRKKIPTEPGDTFFFLSKSPNRLWSLLFIGYRVSFPVVKRPGSDIDHLPPSSAEVKNEWRYNSTPPICLHQGQLYLYFCIVVISAIKNLVPHKGCPTWRNNA